ncbi:hypothetical protein [Mesorhizobium retamae]|uniref:Lipoprotein n=1 Tax=Mesorhizobium retamae TaxID=2912854 RepID=A0ABS9QGL1_9HYPH|nr:hypothetical protein [Mesorhizobium sp. IRAMC:0171]MCG7506560.1 hypothetical protein [Mesorhizobium sp. IRAMC:0171]
MRRVCLTIVPLLAALALSACNKANDVLQPAPATTAPAGAAAPMAASQSVTPANPIAGAPAATGTTPAPTPAQSAAVLSKTRLQIAPIVGASVEAATPLTQRLAARAKESGIAIAGSADQTATHVLKGYFSTISEGKDTTVIYVWDVYDPAGNRLHRINGQQKAPTVNGAEGWAAVPPATMQAIADQTVGQLTSWLAGRVAG